MQSKPTLYLVMILVTGSLVEAACYGIAQFVPRSWYYRPPTRAVFVAYLAGDVDWEIGWRPPLSELAEAGYRRSPAGEGLATPCLALYGDSFTFGSEVELHEAWGNVLAERLGCRVDNYGVPGYGTDQAYLYFRRQHEQGRDQAPVVVLSHLSENIARNITQNFAFLYDADIALKPRFVSAGDGDIRLIEMPHLTPGDYDAYVRDMRQFLRAEALLPASSALAKRHLGFPHLLTVPGLFLYKRLWASLLSGAFKVPPWFAELYDPAHPSQALQVTHGILVAFAREAQRYGKRPLLFILPTARDLGYFRRTGQWSYANLVTMLQASGAAPVMNLGPLLLARVRDDDLCTYFCTQKTTGSGHYTVQGNRLLAEVVYDVIAQLGGLSALR